MPKSVDHRKIREDLMDGVVKAGARYGLDGITNQIIAEMSGQPEPYIYRYYIDRDDLIKKTFMRSDENFFQVLTVNAVSLIGDPRPIDECVFEFLNNVWDYSIKDYDYCRFYIRYYYSIYNTPSLREEHFIVCHKFFNAIKEVFRADLNIDRVMHRLFTNIITTVMDFASGVIEDTRENREEIFGFFFNLLEPYLKKGAHHGTNSEP